VSPFIGLVIIAWALLGTPLFIIISIIAIAGFLSQGIDLIAIIIEMYRLASAPMLLAIPLFTFAGYIMAESNTPKRLVNLSRAFLGWMPGGLAVVALCACAFFTAFTGASGVTIVALGGLLFPALASEKYEEKFSLGLLTTSGSLGLLFPPSLPIIIYGFVAQTSVDQLFVAGIVPGIMLVVMLSLYAMVNGKRMKVERVAFSIGTMAKALRGAAWEIPLPFLVLGGIYGGFITVSEAAAITVTWVFIVEFFIYRDLSLKEVPRVIRESMLLVGGILIIMSAAFGFTSYLIDEQVPMKILSFIKGNFSSQLLFLLMLNALLLVVGCLMDIFSALIIVVPLIVPIARGFDVNLVHLGIIFLANLEIGYMTPPVGLNLFISSFRFNRPIIKLYYATLPFLLILIIALVIITYVPDLSLFLVELFDIT
jgi:tripartite ATP-independent transporter DctM subunit